MRASQFDRSERRLLALAVGSQASISIAAWGLGALGQELRDEFALSAAGLGWILASVMIGNALIHVPAGTVVDRVGPRAPLIVGGIATCTSLVGAGLAGRASLVAAMLFMSGICGAFVALAGTVSLFHGFDPSRRATAVGFRQMAVSLGGLLAAGLLPGLAAIGGVRLSFIGAGVLAGAFAVLFGLESPRGAFTDAASRPPMRGLDLRGLLRTPGMGWVVLISAIQVSALAALLSFAVPAVRDSGGSAVMGAVIFAVVSLSAMCARLWWGRVADRDGGTQRVRTLRTIGLVTAVGGLAYWLVAPLAPAIHIPVAFVFAFGAMGANGVLYVIAGELCGPSRAGQAVGLVSTILFGVGGASAPFFGLQADNWGFRSLWIDAAILGLGTMYFSRFLPTPGGENRQGRTSEGIAANPN